MKMSRGYTTTTNNGRRAEFIHKLTLEGRPPFCYLWAIRYSHGDTHYIYNKEGRHSGGAKHLDLNLK